MVQVLSVSMMLNPWMVMLMRRIMVKMMTVINNSNH